MGNVVSTVAGVINKIEVSPEMRDATLRSRGLVTWGSTIICTHCQVIKQPVAMSRACHEN